MHNVLLNFRVVFNDEIFVLDNVGMVKILSDRELLRHLLDYFLDELLIIVHFHKLADECLRLIQFFNLNCIYCRLTSLANLIQMLYRDSKVRLLIDPIVFD